MLGKNRYSSARDERPFARARAGAWLGVVVAGMVAALVGALTVGAGGAEATPDTVNGGLVAVAGVRPGWAAAGNATGVPASSSTMTTRVFLAGADPRGLAAYAAAVSTPGNAAYRHFLSASEATARFAPSAGAQAAVSSWLTAAGLHVTAANGQYVEVSGTTEEVERAYGVELRTYRSTETGESGAVAPDGDPVVPAALASDIATITGLSSVSQTMYAQHVTAVAASRDLRGRGQGQDGAPTTTPTGPLIPSPCSTYYGQVTDTTDPAFEGVHEPYTVCGYSAGQLRSAYYATGHSGDGATVAVVDAYDSPTMLADANEWSTANGLPEFAQGQYAERVTPSSWNSESACGGTAGWASEQSLDVEAVHAMAPAAHILYYGANSCEDSDLLAALSDLITHHLAQVISDSWGGPLHSTSGSESAATIAEYDYLFQLAAVEGITVNFSSGDCGDNSPSTTCGGSNGLGSSYAQTTFPASDPWVTAVGGTSAAVDSRGHLEWNTSWGTKAWLLDSAGTKWSSLGWIFGGGGGTSADFAQPWYQEHLVPSALSGTLPTGAAAGGARRVVPDISLDADPFTGLLVGETQPLPDGKTGYAEVSIGGTSLASPLLAGLEADAIGVRGGEALGFVNPALYFEGMAGDADTIRDVTDTPSNVARPIGEVFPSFDGQAAAVAGLGSDGALRAVSGYDDATGLGTPGRWFVDTLAICR